MMHLLSKFCSKIQICGTQEYASDLWNVVDFVTNSLYVATIGLRVRAFCDVSFTHFSLKAASKRNETCLIASLPQYLPFAMWKYIIETRNFCSLLGFRVSSFNIKSIAAKADKKQPAKLRPWLPA